MLTWISNYGLGLLVLLAQGINALDKAERIACQTPTSDPLSGCPPGTILVDQSQTAGAFATIQSAIRSLPNDTTPHTILILPGIYTEQLNITRPGPLHLLGQSAGPSSLSGNTVEVIWHQATGTNATGTLDNAFTSTLTIAPTLNSSLTGTGPTGFAVPTDTPFGNVDFRAYNLNFTNDYRPYAAGPSLALSASYSNTGFYACSFKSYQDTVYVGKWGNSYMSGCEVAGQTDFLYGFGTLWIEASTLLMRSCGGGIAAWKGTNTSFENAFGVYVHGSEVRRANASLAIDGRCALGRPWNSLHRSVFAESFLDASIRPSGYIAWGATDPRSDNRTFMAEFENGGPGWNETGRREAGLGRVLTREQWTRYSRPSKVFQYFGSGRVGNVGWVDWEAP